MEPGSAASSALVTPLAVDDVFRHRSVPEVQELLRQLQLQQANDVEELRSLIGVRYLSFLDGLPDINHMQQSAEYALEDARAFGDGLRRLADALGSAAPDVGEQHSPEDQQLSLEEELPLQSSTPLEGSLFSCEADASPSAVYIPVHGGHSAEQASRFLAHSSVKEGQGPHRQAKSLRYLQQQLLLLPSRVWEAARCQKFLEALRVIRVEGAQQAAAAMAAVRVCQQQQQGLKPAQQDLERQLSGCWSLAQQVTRISPSLIVSLRALALRQLASPELSLPVVADAAAAATLIYLLENRPSVGEACATAEKALKESAAKWLLGVFFFARVEALEAVMVKRKKDAPPAAVHIEQTNYNCSSDAIQPAVDAAEAMLVAFAASLEAAVFLFSPEQATNCVLGATDISSKGVSVACNEGKTFAAALAAEAAFCDASALDSTDVSWALKALPGVFATFAAQPCFENSNKREWGCPCSCEKNSALCPRAMISSFIEQWLPPLREQLCLLPSEDPRRNLRDIRLFWLRLVEKLKERGPRWQLPTGVAGSATSSEAEGCHSQIAFEKGLLYHLADIADLCGGSEDQPELRAALPLRAAIAASFLQSLAECTAPLAERASVTVASSNGHIRDKDAYAALIQDARRVEWLFVAYREAEILSDHDKNVVSTEIPTIREQTPKDPKGADCRRRLVLFLADWVSSDSRNRSVPEVCLVRSKERDEAEEGNNFETTRVIAAATAAAQCLLPSLCFSSFIGYAVGFWPFVKTSVEALQKSWQWHRKTSATPPFEAGISTTDISGGAMSFLLELNRHLTSVSWSLRVERMSDSPLLSFAIKAVAAEAVAGVAVPAVAEAKGPDNTQQRGQHASPSPSSQSHLLQLLIDIELIAEALDESSPLQQAYRPSGGVGALPEALHRAVEAGLGGRRCAEALRNTAKEGRQWLQPPFVELLQRRLKTGFTASNSLIWALLPPCSSEAGRVQAFEAFSRSSSYEKCEGTAAHNSVPNSAKAEGEQQQALKEGLKQLQRLRLDDAVDSVSRGLQSWLKRGSSDTDGSGRFPSRPAGGASSGTSKGVTAVAAAGSGLAEAWAKQVGHVSALIGHHVESVQRASQAAGSSQRNGKQGSANVPASLSADLGHS
ncbi:hypothetical protein, conserved [Eimeria brunetti]|uniref:Uncharacterized protein n=1 Tax=Eimeria brunetti TaxID=51314 RepID=U6LZ20_9EIME|nr:hypothetical protein, conserved [Eimeria brunetti]